MCIKGVKRLPAEYKTLLTLFLTFKHEPNTQSCKSSTVSDADMQRYESVMSWRAHDGEVYSVEFSYDENTVLSIGEDGKVCLFILYLYYLTYTNLVFDPC